MTKILKYIGIGVLAIILLFTGFIYVSGDTYVFFLLKNTVLQGRMGPTIDDYEIFENRVVETGTPIEWIKSENYNASALLEEETRYHQVFKSAAFLVIQNDELLFEKYWDSYSDSSHTNSWSMAKSVISHLVGCALKDGLIKDLKDPIGLYLPEYESNKVTIEDLLTMSSGFNYDEDYMNPFSYPARSLYDSDIREIHKRYEQVGEAGKYFDYQSANTQLLGFILMKVTGKTLSQYASEKLWKPIGAEHPALWSLDNENGIEKAFCCFNTNARDFAKFGHLYLNKGIINGDTLISSDYYAKCTTSATHLLVEGLPNEKYGYQWWIVQIEGENVFYARGINGQYIFVLPESNLVIVRLGQSRPTLRIKGHPEDVYTYIRQGRRLALVGMESPN